MLKNFLVVIMGLALVACDPYEEPAPVPEPAPVVVQEDSAPETIPVETPVDSVPELVDLEPAQEACVPSLTVNGATSGVVIGVPSRLLIEVVDCPAGSEEVRDQAAHRLNFGGAATGYGSGQYHVVIRPPFQSAYELGPESPEGNVSRAYKIEAQGATVVSILTTPSRRSTPTNRVDRKVVVTQDIRVRQVGTPTTEYFSPEGLKQQPEFIAIRYTSSDGSRFAIDFRP